MITSDRGRLIGLGMIIVSSRVPSWAESKYLTAIQGERFGGQPTFNKLSSVSLRSQGNQPKGLDHPTPRQGRMDSSKES